MTALALRDDQTYWDESQLSVLQASGIDEGVTKAELQTFLHECQRRKLDPFTRQIYLIGRWDRRQKRKVYRSQTSIDGFRLIARRAADRAGINYSYEDTIWYDVKGGRHEIWLADTPPAGAKVVVVRNGSRYDAEVRFGEYVVVNDDGAATGQWKTRPATMIAKCCEALALRKAFPEDLGGLYTEEEMAQADNPQRVTAEVIKSEPNGHASSNGKSQQGNPHEDPWIVHPAPDEEPEWAAQEARMGSFATDADGQKLWAAVVSRKQAKKINAAECERLKAVIRGRWKELTDSRSAGDSAPLEGKVVSPQQDLLGGGWRETIDGITTTDEGMKVIQAADKDHADGILDSRKHKAVLSAVGEKVASLPDTGEAA